MTARVEAVAGVPVEIVDRLREGHCYGQWLLLKPPDGDDSARAVLADRGADLIETSGEPPLIRTVRVA